MNKAENLLIKLYLLKLLISYVKPCKDLDFTRLTNDCSKFYRCSNHKIYTFECPPGLLFDESVKVCNYANVVNCHTQTTSMGMITTLGTNYGIYIYVLRLHLIDHFNMYIFI
jgi:hypothetical protein